MSGNTYQITPFMHVLDCDEAVRFFFDILGFTAVIDQGGYAYLDREGAGLRIMGHKNEPHEIGAPHRRYAYYVDVRDVGVVIEEIGEKLAQLPDGHVRGPVDQPYGQRELMIRAPDGNLVVFGQAIESTKYEKGDLALNGAALSFGSCHIGGQRTRVPQTHVLQLSSNG